MYNFICLPRLPVLIVSVSHKVAIWKPLAVINNVSRPLGICWNWNLQLHIQIAGITEVSLRNRNIDRWVRFRLNHEHDETD